MAQLWGGRFTKETDKLVYNFNASISFDQKFYKQDIRGSKAHVRMLAKQGILTEEERDQILGGLDSILADVESGKLEITSEYEDIQDVYKRQGSCRPGSCQINIFFVIYRMNVVRLSEKAAAQGMRQPFFTPK